MGNLGEKKTVLVVDDAPANLQIVNSILKDDYKIRVATSGAKAGPGQGQTSTRSDLTGRRDAGDGRL